MGSCVKSSRESGCRAPSRKKILFNLEQCGPVWMSSVESHLGLLDSIVCSAERLCEDELCCLGLGRKVSALGLL